MIDCIVTPRFHSLSPDDACQTFLEDEFTFEIQLAAKGQKRLQLAPEFYNYAISVTLFR